MKKLDINITKAQLSYFSVLLNEEGRPQVQATLSLLTEGGKKITDYSIHTNTWQEENKFELPMEAIRPMAELGKILERVAAQHCRDSQKAIAAPKSEETVKLDDIPF